MHHRTKLILATLVVAIAFGALVGTTSANRFALSSQTFRATWNPIRFVGTAGIATIECHLTIEGSFHSKTSSKITESLAGYIARSIVDEGHCTGGSARVLSAFLPWHIRYESFTGTLPKITSVHVRVIGNHFLIAAAGALCLFGSTAASPLKDLVNINTNTGIAEALQIEAAQIPFVSGSNLVCGLSASLEGVSSSLTVQGATTKITVTLVQ